MWWDGATLPLCIASGGSLLTPMGKVACEYSNIDVYLYTRNELV